MPTKTITISEETWKRLSLIKLKSGKKTIEDVIIELLEKKC